MQPKGGANVTSGYFDAKAPELPTSLRWARAAVVSWAVVSLCWAVVAVVTLMPSARGVGTAAVMVAPEVAGGVLALRMARTARAGRLPGRALLVVTVLELVLAIGGVASAKVRGLAQVVLPAVVLVLLVHGMRELRGRQARARYEWHVAAGDPGSSMVEYVGTVLLAVMTIGAFSATGVGGYIAARAGVGVCGIFVGTDCDTARAIKSAEPGGRERRDANGTDDRRVCRGTWECAWHYSGVQAGGMLAGASDHVSDVASGLADPRISEIPSAASSAWDDPVTAPASGNAGGDPHGDYGMGFGDTVVCVGLLFPAGIWVVRRRRDDARHRV